MEFFILAFHVIAAISIIVLVLLQHGKGADMGAAFGSGASGSLFGSSGTANFLSRLTAVCAAVFFASTLALSYFGNSRQFSHRLETHQRVRCAPARRARRRPHQRRQWPRFRRRSVASGSIGPACATAQSVVGPSETQAFRIKLFCSERHAHAVRATV